MYNQLILGTVQMGQAYGINNRSGKIPYDACFEILRAARAMQISILDTAEEYGDSHQIIGKFHRDHPDLTFRVITKIGEGSLAGDLQLKVKGYLADLALNQLEALMFHSYGSYHANTNIIPKLLAMKQDGLFAKLGVSIYTNSELEALIQDENIDLIQLPYNLLDNAGKRGDLLQLARQNRKTIHTRSTFLQGLFFMSVDEFPEQFLELIEPVKHLKALAQKCNMEMNQFALSYALSNKNTNGVIVGIDNVAQLRENIGGHNRYIPEEIVKAIDSINIYKTELLDPRKWTEM
jgi:aryl-alcohol dehydrogenase-like predicted oxidoreductase